MVITAKGLNPSSSGISCLTSWWVLTILGLSFSSLSSILLFYHYLFSFLCNYMGLVFPLKFVIIHFPCLQNSLFLFSLRLGVFNSIFLKPFLISRSKVFSLFFATAKFLGCFHYFDVILMDI